MKISSSMEYAARLMVVLARSPEVAVSGERLSESENVPLDYVNQLLMRLRRAGLVASQRGLGGGYSLSRPPAQIKLGEVLRAVEGRIFEDVCQKYADADKDCHHQSGCAISPVWQRLGALIEQYFDGITLAQLAEEEPAACGKAAAMLSRIPRGKA